MKKAVFSAFIGMFVGSSVFSQESICTPDGTSGRIRNQDKSQVCNLSSANFKNIYEFQQFWIPKSVNKAKTLKYRIHFIQKSDGSGNWVDNQDTKTRMNQINFWINQHYKVLAPSYIDFPNAPKISDAQIRFECVGLHFYQNDALWSNSQTSTLEEFITTNYPERDDAYHIFITGGTYGSAAGYSFFPSYGDISGSDHSIWTSGNEADPNGDYLLSCHLAHEFGHSLDLRHMYNHEWCKVTDKDFLDDVYPINFPGATPSSGCDVKYFNASCDLSVQGNYCTNNMMSGKQLLSYHVSPKQIGRIHRVAYLKETREFIWGYSTTPMDITSNQTWDFSIKLYEDLVIKAGATLTVTCEIQFVPEAKVIIEPGGQLILDGGKLTVAKRAKGFWGGVQVYGNRNASQSNFANQGVLIMKNGAVIENAYEAVQMWKFDDFNTTGGIIQASNSTFKNNRRSVAFYPYHSYTTSGVERTNRSYFTNCTFIVDKDRFAASSSPFITIFDVNGVSVNGCDFTDLRTDVALVDRVSGVAGLNAGFNVRGTQKVSPTFINPGTYDETMYDVCRFTNLKEGVIAQNSNSAATVVIDQCNFTNVYDGVTIKAVNFANSNRCYFNYTSNHPLDINRMNSLTVRNSTGYRIEGNIFDNTSTQANVNGIIIENSGTANNEIYKNTFKNQLLASTALGVNTNNNGSSFSNQGFTFLCNTYQNSSLVDQNIISTYNSGINGGIRLNQGSFIGGPTKNLFSDLKQGLVNFRTDDQDVTLYYINTEADKPKVTVGPIGYFNTNVQNNCSTRFTNIRQGGVKYSTELGGVLQPQIDQLGNDITKAVNNLTANLNRGNSETLKNAIRNMNALNVLNVKSELESKSPYLSKDVLQLVGSKVPLLYNQIWYVDLLNKNLEVTRSNEMTTYLRGLNLPLVNNLLNTLNLDNSYKMTNLGRDIDNILGLQSNKDVLVNELISNEICNDSIIDWNKAKLLVQTKEDLRNIYSLIDFQVELNQSTTDLMTKLTNDIVYTEPYYATEKLNYVDFRSLLNTDIQALATEKYDQLVSIRDRAKDLPALQAENILCFFKGECSTLDVKLAKVSNDKKYQSTVSLTDVNNSFGINIYPNPNQGMFMLNMSSDFELKSIKVFDVAGKEQEFKLSFESENLFKISLDNAPNGIYFIQLEDVNQLKETIKFVKN